MTDSDRTPGLVAVVLLAHGREEDGRPTYVVTRRRPGSHLAGAWELPGGKLEPGEPPTAAARRELSEELGVIVGDLVPLTFSWHAYDDRTLLLLFFEARTTADSPEPEARAAEALKLVNLETLVALPMPAANAPLVALLRARLETGARAPSG